jgi:hypothetical protein
LLSACLRHQAHVSEIACRAHSGFLWSELVLDALNTKIENGANEAEIDDTLQDIPDELEEFYEKLLDTLVNNKQYKGGQKRRMEEAYSLVTWVLLAAEPLTVRDLRYAIGFREPFDYSSLVSWKISPNCVQGSKRYLKRIQDLSCGLIEIRPATTAQSLLLFLDVVSVLRKTLGTNDLSICATGTGIEVDYSRNASIVKFDQDPLRMQDTANEEIEAVEQVAEIEGSLVQFIHNTVRTFFLLERVFPSSTHMHMARTTVRKKTTAILIQTLE